MFDWVKSQKATITPKNNDDKCLKYAVAFALNHENIAQGSQKV